MPHRHGSSYAALLMGTMINAACDCGFNRKLYAGGGMAGGATSMPYWCQHCGMVEASVERPGDDAACPSCGRAGALPYGQSPLSFQYGKCCEDFDGYRLTERKHRCPTCMRLTLRLQWDGDWD